MTDTIDELGPVDYLVIEFPADKRAGEGLPLLLDLVDSGTVRVLDLVFVQKDSSGTVSLVSTEELGARGASGLAAFEGAASGLIGVADLDEIGEVLSPDSVGIVLVYENTWTAPFARALHRGGGQLVAGGRIPVQALLAALDADAA